MSAFQDQVVWITGSSSGVGEGLAEAFAEAGAMLVLSARRALELERVRKKLPGSRVLVLPMDVTQADELEAGIRTVDQHFGRIDVLVCNAGVGQHATVADTTLDTFHRILNVNLYAVIAHVKAVLPAMRERGSGQIVVTSSVAGKFGIPGMSGYCAAKHAVQGFCDSLRAEEADHGIDVTTLILAGVDSNFSPASLTGGGATFGGTTRKDDVTMPALEAGRQIVAQLARRSPEINVVADPRARQALRLKRLRPQKVFARMAELARRSGWK
ncbi:MAG: SDR family NAD(P)-dependent oxidoreductase [Gammaproteobacteria bacterium]